MQHLSWSRAMVGYQALVAQYGVTSVGQNQLAQMAARFGDYMVTDETMTQIGDHWDPGTWGTKEYFDKVKTWAQGFRRSLPQDHGRIQSGDGQRGHPEGQKYDSRDCTRVFQPLHARGKRLQCSSQWPCANAADSAGEQKRIGTADAGGAGDCKRCMPATQAGEGRVYASAQAGILGASKPVVEPRERRQQIKTRDI